MLISDDRDGRVRSGRLARRLAGVAEVRSHGHGHHAHWQELAAAALSPTGTPAGERPAQLWIALGDSSALAHGATCPDTGYIGQVRAELTRRTSRPWHVLNLASAGALTRDVLTEQLPELRRLLAAGHQPDLLQPVAPLGHDPAERGSGRSHAHRSAG